MEKFYFEKYKRLVFLLINVYYFVLHDAIVCIYVEENY